MSASYPQQDIKTIPELLNYINTFIIDNGVEEITGIKHNNVVNAVVKFITRSTINYANAAIVNGGSLYTLTTGVTIFSASPSGVFWADNFYNEWLVVNRGASDIPLNPGLFYVDQFGNQRTSIPAGEVVHLTKMSNGYWAQANNQAVGGTTNAYYGNIDS